MYDDLVGYHESISELPSAKYYDLIVAWEFHTYLLEAVQYTPLICLFAVPERGKSRTGKGMIYVSYRGTHVESLRESYIFRLADNFRASIFFDTMDFWGSVKKNGSEDVILSRFEKGLKVPRVLYPDRGRFDDIETFSVFGPTIIGTNKGIDHILDTRAIQITLPESRKRFENDVTPDIALPFKERLVAFRAKYLREKLPDIPKPAHGRLGDILKPLLQIIHLVKPDRKAPFLELVKEIEADRKIGMEENEEVKVLRILSDCTESVRNGVLPLQEVANLYNQDKPDIFRSSNKRISNVTRSLGFKIVKIHGGKSGIQLDEDLIDRLKERYGIGSTHPEQPSPSSPRSQNNDNGISREFNGRKSYRRNETLD